MSCNSNFIQDVFFFCQITLLILALIVASHAMPQGFGGFGGQRPGGFGGQRPGGFGGHPDFGGQPGFGTSGSGAGAGTGNAGPLGNYYRRIIIYLL